MAHKKFTTKFNTSHSTSNASNASNASQYSIEVVLTASTTFDVRLLRVSLTYPYMFAQPSGPMFIDRNWNVAFKLTCMEIDAFLGEDKRGFHWRQLDIEVRNDGARPYWYWALNPQYNQTVMVHGADSTHKHPRVEICNSAEDPNNALRSTIAAMVDKGMRRAVFVTQDAGIQNTDTNNKDGNEAGEPA